MLYCFLDTNIFLEFRPLNEIPWCKELNVTEAWLVVTSVVMRELDKHKSSNSRRKSKRAQDALRFLENADVSGNHEICQNVSLRFERPEPNQHTLDANNLSTSVPDDILIAKAIEFAALNQSHTVAVVSGDFGVRLKARGVNLCVPILDEFRLDPETDPLVKENQELRNELQRLQKSRPNLKIGFESDSGKLVTFLSADVSVSADYITEAEIKSCVDSKRSEILYESNIDQSLFGPHSSVFRSMTKTDTFEYGDYVDSWLTHRFAHFVRAQSFRDVFHNRSVTIALTLHNAGLGTAEGLNITLNIPGPWRLELNLPDEPPFPGEPASQSQWRLSQDSPHLDNMYDLSDLEFEMTNSANVIVTRNMLVNEPDLKAVKYAVSRLRSDESIGLDPFYLFPNSPENVSKLIEIEYELLKSNPGPKQQDTLSVIVNSGE